MTWQYILELQTRRNFEILVSKGLAKDEVQRASSLRLEMPLETTGLLDFWAKGDTVYVPVLSLKFLNDILLANAWLYYHGFDPGTIDEYVAMLKYRDASNFPGGRYPRPLDALGIPQSSEGGLIVGSDKEVEEAYFGSSNIASGFIMAHEIGHVLLGHTKQSGKTVAERVRDEQAADAFALRVVSRVQPEVEYMTMYFSLTAVWSPNKPDFSSPQEYQAYLSTLADHPVTAERIRALGREAYKNPARFLYPNAPPENLARMQRLGLNVIKVGDLSDNEAEQKRLAIIGRYAPLVSVKPRPTGVPVPRPKPWQ